MRINLTSSIEVAGLIELLKDENPVLVIVDTQARCTVGAEENSAKDMGQIVAHPLVKLLRDCERDAHALGAALGLDPVSAARIAAGKDASLDWATAFPELNEIRQFEPGQPGYNADLDG